MLSTAARPAAKTQLSGSVERASALVPHDKSTLVNPGEILDWTIVSENIGNAAALGYKTVGHIPQATTFVADSAKPDGAKAFYTLHAQSFSPQPMIPHGQTEGSLPPIPPPRSLHPHLLSR